MSNLTSPANPEAHPGPDAPQLAQFSRALIAWQKEHGRHDLPWQQNRDPYRVWLSEIMLQQTQVVTVKEYFLRFLDTFPTVEALARGSSEQVMALWAGLGYYSRARNLHRCAQEVVNDWGGQFPSSAQALQTLSGIGPSTAAAIASTCFHERVAILDGNVKRVLARWLGFDADIGDTASVKWLHAVAQGLAEQVRNAEDMPTFTQGLMDLGATLCKPKQPACERCPMRQSCQALAKGRQHELPLKRSRVKRQTQRWWLVFAHCDDGSWAWCRRPPKGIWPDLYTPLIFDTEDAARAWLSRHAQTHEVLPMLKHALTHRDLFLYPAVAQMRSGKGEVDAQVQWLPPQAVGALGLPAPILKLWEQVSR